MPSFDVLLLNAIGTRNNLARDALMSTGECLFSIINFGLVVGVSIFGSVRF